MGSEMCIRDRNIVTDLMSGCTSTINIYNKASSNSNSHTGSNITTYIIDTSGQQLSSFSSLRGSLLIGTVYLGTSY